MDKKYCNGSQNKFIDDLINEKAGEPLLSFELKSNDIEIRYTNTILQKILGEKHFEWSDPTKNRNSFGQALYYNKYRLNFEKIPIINDKINKIPINAFPCANIGITNIWIVINNIENRKLDDLVESIELMCGGCRFAIFRSDSIENEINILAYIFKVHGIKYKDDKIYIPMIMPYNSFILNGILHETCIYINKKEDISQIDYEIWGNICDTKIFPQLSHTNNLNHKFSSICYKTESTGGLPLSIRSKRIRLDFNHPTYALYITNISKDYIKSIKIFLRDTESALYANNNAWEEFQLNDIEWFNNHAIIWFNRNFLSLNEFNNSINFSRHDGYVMIDNSYIDARYIEVCSIRFEVLIHMNGMCGAKFSS